MAIVNHGLLATARQWMTALSPSADGLKWNYIVEIGSGGPSTPGVEFIVIKDITGTPSQATFEPPWPHSSVYGNTNFQIVNQLRALNGRIFLPQEQSWLPYYEPTTESIVFTGPLVESPPTNPNAATLLYSARFDTAGQLYMATQESQSRPTCVVSVDPTATPPAMNIIAYLSSAAEPYTDYGYTIAADTVTANKFVYVIRGESPWELWAINITPGPNYGVTTLLDSVASTGALSFSLPSNNNPVNSGWVIQKNSFLGPGDVITRQWIIDGVLYPYTPGIAPPSPRNCTPASNALAGAPSIDTSIPGAVGWRFGGSDPYTYVYYNVDADKVQPQRIEALISTSGGVYGHVESYQGSFTADSSSVSLRNLGPNRASEAAMVSANGLIYITGYPNSVLFVYDPTKPFLDPWLTLADSNPKSLGNFGINGTQYAGTKYSRCLAWTPTAGASGRLYEAGDRERNGIGCGIGYWDKTSGTFAGVYSAADGSTGPTIMSSLFAAGLTTDDTHGLVALATKTISGTGDAPIIVFNQALSSWNIYTPFPGVSALGPLAQTPTSNIIAGAYMSGGFLNLYRFDVQTGQVLLSAVTPYRGSIGGHAVGPDGTLWLAVDATIVGVSPTTLLTKTVDITSITSAQTLAVTSSDIFMASGATLYSTPVPATPFTVPHIDPNVLFPSGEIGRALDFLSFFDLLIQTVNQMCTKLSIATVDANILRPSASTGKAKATPAFLSSMVTAINSMASALAQPTLDPNILAPTSKTGAAFSPPSFYMTIIAMINSLIDHLV